MTEDEVYEQIDKELNGGSLVRSLWMRVYAEADGDEAKAKARYIRERASQLTNANSTSDKFSIGTSQNNYQAQPHGPKPPSTLPKVKFCIEPQFGSIGPFQQGLAAFSHVNARDLGFLDASGNIVIPPRYSEVRHFRNGVAIASVGENQWSGGSRHQNKLFGIIDLEGRWLVPPRFSRWETDDSNIFLGDNSGNSGNPDLYEEFRFSHNSRKLEKIEKKIRGFFFGSSDIYPVKFSEFHSNGFWDRKKINKYGFINRDGQWVIEPQFGDGSTFRAGTLNGERAIIQSGSYLDDDARDIKYGLIDRAGKVLCSPKYDQLGFPDGDYFTGIIDTFYGFARLNLSSGQSVWFHVDKNGQSIYEEKFSGVGYFKLHGIAKATIGYGSSVKSGIINKSGKFIIQPIYQDIEPLTNSLFAAKISGKFGLIDLNEKWIVEPNFDYLRYNNFAEHKVPVFFGHVDEHIPSRSIGNWGVIDLRCYEN